LAERNLTVKELLEVSQFLLALRGVELDLLEPLHLSTRSPSFPGLAFSPIAPFSPFFVLRVFVRAFLSEKKSRVACSTRSRTSKSSLVSVYTSWSWGVILTR